MHGARVPSRHRPAVGHGRAILRCRFAPPLFEPLETRDLMSSTVFLQTNIISDGAIPAVNAPDPHLTNAWGLSFGPNTPFWVSANGTGLATIYNSAGVKQSLEVMIPGAAGNDPAPTGQLFNPTTDFKVSANGKSAPAVFIFAGEDGGISGWNPTVDGTHAILEVNSTDGAVFKGVTMTTMNGQNVLLAADFHNNRVDIFDASFHPVSMPGAFTDRHMRKGFAPFNVQTIGDRVYVTYAKQDSDAHDDVAKAGNGFVDVFNTSGKLVKRLQHGGFLNSPWGVTAAPASWGKLAGDVLVGNFGSGQIDAFDPHSGKFRGSLHGTDGKKLTIDGLWALSFGNGNKAGDPNTLYFTAGPNGEADGLFGSLTMQSKKHNTLTMAHR